MPTPSYIDTGTTDAGAGAGIAPSYGDNEAGDLFVAQITVRNISVGAATPSGWTVRDADVVGPIGQYYFTRDDRSTGGETGSVSFANIVGDSIIGAIHTFRGVALADYIEAQTMGGESGSPDRQTVEAPSITAGGNNRLAVSLISVSNNADTIDSFTGESGGDWTEAFYVGSGVGSNCEMQVQSAALDAGGTVSGGSCSNSDDEWISHSFALVGTADAAPEATADHSPTLSFPALS